MTHTDIQGWFTWERLYDYAVAAALEPAHFVEIGCWKGKSTIYLAQQIKHSGKKIRLDAVDTWQGDPNVEEQQFLLENSNGKLYDEFIRNVKRAGLEKLINPIRAASPAVAKTYHDASLDLVFLDGDHRYEVVNEELAAWKPKIKPGGILAGHDYTLDWPGVVAAVQEYVKRNNLRLGIHQDCWVLQIEG